jgi:CheY-like chemotaxis protein
MKDLVLLLAEDNEAQAVLVEKNLRNSGIMNKIIHFWHGGEVLDFLCGKGTGQQRDANTPYLLLLDIRMPVMDGKEVLDRIKYDERLKKLPVIMLTTSDDPGDVDVCHKLGCSAYIAKPVTYEKFVEAIRNLGLFLKVVSVPRL